MKLKKIMLLSAMTCMLMGGNQVQVFAYNYIDTESQMLTNNRNLKYNTENLSKTIVHSCSASKPCLIEDNKANVYCEKGLLEAVEKANVAGRTNTYVIDVLEDMVTSSLLTFYTNNIELKSTTGKGIKFENVPDEVAAIRLLEDSIVKNLKLEANLNINSMLILAYGKNNTIDTNKFIAHPNAEGRGITVGTGAGVDSDNLFIRGNTFDNTGVIQAPMYINPGPNLLEGLVTISENILNGTSDLYSIGVDANNVVIKDNVLNTEFVNTTYNPKASIRVSGAYNNYQDITHLVVTGNTFTNQQEQTMDNIIFPVTLSKTKLSPTSDISGNTYNFDFPEEIVEEDGILVVANNEETFENAINNINNVGGTILLTDDFSLTKGYVFKNNIAINGNNKTITFDVMAVKTHPIAINNAEVIIKDLTIERNDSSNVFATIGFSNAKKLDLSGSTITVPQFDETSTSPHKNASGIGINGKCENIIFKNNTFKNATTLAGDQLSKAPMYIMARENDKILLEGNTFEGNYRESVTFEINAAGMKINVIKNTFKNNICPTEGTFITNKSYPSPYQIQFKPQTSYTGSTKLEGLIEENIFVAGETYTFPIGITLNKASDMDINNIEFKNNIFPKQPEEIASTDIGWLATPLKNVIQKDKISYPGIMLHEKANWELPTEANYVNSDDETKYSVWSHYESYFKSNMYFYDEVTEEIPVEPEPEPEKPKPPVNNKVSVDIEFVFPSTGVSVNPHYIVRDTAGNIVYQGRDKTILLSPGNYIISHSVNGGGTTMVMFGPDSKHALIYLPIDTSTGESNSGGGSSSGGGGGGGGGFSGTGTLIVGDGSKKESGNTTTGSNNTTKPDNTINIKDDDTPLGALEPLYKDVPFEHWGNKAIEELTVKKILTGFEDNMFFPGQNLTRAQFSLMIFNSMDFKKGDNSKNYSDVIKGQWYFEAVDVLSSLGIVNGFENGDFRPNQSITREQMAVIIYNSLQNQGIKLTAVRNDLPNDFNLTSDYAKTAVTVLFQSGLVSGTGTGNYDPQSNATRAESAVLVHNLLSKLK